MLLFLVFLVIILWPPVRLHLSRGNSLLRREFVRAVGEGGGDGRLGRHHVLVTREDFFEATKLRYCSVPGTVAPWKTPGISSCWFRRRRGRRRGTPQTSWRKLTSVKSISRMEKGGRSTKKFSFRTSAQTGAGYCINYRNVLVAVSFVALDVKKADGGEMWRENNYSSTVTAIRSADKKRRGSCRHVDVGGCRRDVISLVFIPAQK